MYRPIKEALESQRFNNIDEVEEFVRTWLCEFPNEFSDTGIKKLLEMWIKYVISEEIYLEKL